MNELLILLRVIRIEVNPLEFYNCIGVHPFWRYFRVESELLDLDGSEFIEIFCGTGIQEHSNFGNGGHIVLILKYLNSLYLFIGLSFLIDLIVLVLHLLCSICHLNHNLLILLHLNLSYFYHCILIVLLLLLMP